MFQSLIAHFNDLFASAQTALFVGIVQPVLYHAGWITYADSAYDGVQWFLVGVIEILAMYALLRPLEAWRPVERWPDRRALRVDVLYTLLHRLGLFNLAFFLLFQPAFDALQGFAHLHGFETRNLADLWPGFAAHPLPAFLVYLVILDFAGYWYHRGEHRFRWWWALHAVHHSQRRLSLWADDRNHLLDDALLASYFALVALAIGVAPPQFVLLVALGQFAQSFQHVNARLPLGWLGERLVVSPTFHRRHHAIGLGHEGPFYGCNFGVLLPWWDIAFGTADFDAEHEPTGIRDQLDPPLGRRRDYGEGFWAQQFLGLRRLAQTLGPRRAG